MDFKLILTIALSLGLTLLILGFAAWLLHLSKKEEKHFKGIPEKARKWMKAEKVFGWASLAAFLGLMVAPARALVTVFMLLLGLYFICYGVAVYLAEHLEDLGFGPTYYGKAARLLGLFIICFGGFIFAIGIGGLFL